MSGAVPTPFDGLAAGYDDAFSRGAVGARLRRAAWRRLDAELAPGSWLLDLGGGTGEDALHMAGRGLHVMILEPSSGMAAEARRKAAAAELAERVLVREAAMEDLAAVWRDAGAGRDGGFFDGWPGRFDAALSNFGALNCVADPAGVARDLAACLRPGGQAWLGVMGPLVPWEWLWFLARLRPAAAFRRLRRGGAAWRGLTVRYPSAGRLARDFAPWFQPRSVCALGLLLPPTYAGRWAERHPRLLDRLDRWERRIEAHPAAARLSDHYLIQMERR